MNEPINLSTESRRSTVNYILNALPEEDFQRLLPDLEPIKLALGQVIYRPDEKITHVYFPNNAMISIIAVTSQGQCAEIGITGREGMTGMDVILGADSTNNEHMVQHAADGFRVKTDAVKAEFKRGDALQDLLLGFTRLTMLQIGQTALCNRLHSVEQRLARWLLISRDRSGADKLHLTQEFLSLMLGTNRATVTVSAIALQSAGFIAYRRGHITILDSEGLKNFSCECYQAVKNEYDRFQNIKVN